MDRSTAGDILENIEMLKAFAQGKTIQMRYFNDDGTAVWKDRQNPLFTGSPEDYRIKPEPVEVEVWYHECGTVYSIASNKECDRYMIGKGFRKIKLREVV